MAGSSFMQHCPAASGHCDKVWPGGGRRLMTSEPSAGASADVPASHQNTRPQQQEMTLAMVLG